MDGRVPAAGRRVFGLLVRALDDVCHVDHFVAVVQLAVTLAGFDVARRAC